MARSQEAREELARMVAHCWRDLPSGHERVELPLTHVRGGAWGEGEDNNVFHESMPLYFPEDVIVVTTGDYGDGEGDMTNGGLNFCVARVVKWLDAEAKLVVHYCGSGKKNRVLRASQRKWLKAWINPRTGTQVRGTNTPSWTPPCVCMVTGLHC